MIVGPHIATIRKHGQVNPMFEIHVPNSMLEELRSKNIELEHLDKVRITIEKIGTKANARPWGFKKKQEPKELI